MQKRDHNYFVRLKKSFRLLTKKNVLLLLKKKRNSWLIRHFRDVSYEIKKVAIDVYPYTIEYIDNPEESLQMQAFQKNPCEKSM